MKESPALPHLIRFGVYEVNLQTEELRKSGLKIRLRGQPFQVLAMLLERPGEVVTREELQKKLWPDGTFVDFDHSLNTAITKIREALGDSAENPRFVETLARRGYRFIGPVDTPTKPTTASQADAWHWLTLAFPIQNCGRWHKAPATLLVLVFLLAGLLAFWLKPPMSPKVVGSTQITTDGWLKSRYGFPLLGDGSRLYFSEKVGGGFVLGQVSSLGGDTVRIPTPFKNVFPYAISPRRPELLIATFDGEMEHPLWILPLPGGAPRRLGDLQAHDAAWSPDGKRIIYARGQDLFMAGEDGGTVHRLATVSGRAWWLRWSPDGRRLRFSLGDPKIESTSLWEIAADGSGCHPLLPGWSNPAAECCGNWTTDGKYFIFSSSRQGTSNIWATRESGRFLQKSTRIPTQLTSGPMSCYLPLPSQDGKKIFVVGVQRRGELLRFDPKAGQFVPYASGMSADWLAFSNDQQWIAYTTYPEGILWRSRPDGNQRIQLSFPPLQALQPRWSPDGRQIAFVAVAPGKPWKIHLLSTEGGTPTPLAPGGNDEVDPDWSPDGSSIIYGGLPPKFRGNTARPLAIHLFDLRTSQVSTIPGSEGLFTPRWSPDGRYIAALPSDSQKLFLFDFMSRHWTELARISISYLSWSRDGKQIYFNSELENDPAVYRVSIDDRKLERLVSLKDVQLATGTYGSWSGLTPDDCFLLTRDVGTQEIYALDWVAP